MPKRVGKGLVVTLTLIVGLVWISPAGSASEVVLVDQGKTKAVISLGKNPTSIERHSANELAEYIKQMSGARLRIVKGAKTAGLRVKNIVLIGRAETNEKIKELSKKGLVRISPEYPGLDGFIIKTVNWEEKDYLVLGGSIDRGTMYAVYHFLEKQLNVGFFEDGDRIPKEKSIVVDCDIAERPYFEFRGAVITCPLNRNAASWGEKEWKQEIDWLLKKKYNMMMDIGNEWVKRRDVLQYVGGEKWMLDYGRERGMRFILQTYRGQVSADFMRAHPEVRYLTFYWPDSDDTLYFIDPRDPFLVNFATERLKTQIQDYGTDHLYTVQPWCETPLPGKSKEEKRQIVVALARATTQALVNADPQAVNVMHGWPFSFTQFWPSEDVKAYLDAIVSDLIITDMTAQRDATHKKHNYFWGREWIFCVTFGAANLGIHGDIEELVEKVQAVTTDPKSKHCVGVYSGSESIRYNFLYYDLFSELGWDPRKIKLQSFLKDYATRRYGRESAEAMLPCLERLANTVYKHRYLYNFPHFYRLPHPPGVTTSISSSLLAPLEDAIRIALRERERQVDNPLYARDLIDMTRLYLDNILNLHIAGLETAFAQLDKTAFEQEAKAIDFYLDNLEKVTSTWPDYCLQTQIDAAAKIPEPARAGISGDRWIKEIVTTTIERYPVLCDVQHSDYFELIRFYYRKRIGFYIETLREKMSKGINKVTLEELDPVYRTFHRDWVNIPFKVEEKDRFPGTPIEAVVAVFGAIEKPKRTLE